MEKTERLMKGIIVLGAGGHAKVCIELLRETNQNVAFCIGGADSPELCLGIPVLMGDEHLSELNKKGYHQIFIAVGSNTLRQRLAKIAQQQGFKLVNAISRYAVISPTAKLGNGIAIMAGAIINAESQIGNLAIINTGATIDHDCRIGNATHIAPQCALAGGVLVGERSFLGIGTVVIPEIKIGCDAIVGAGAAVIRNINSGETVVGIPAKTTK